MQYFQSSGLWFPAHESSNAVGGTLSYSPDGLHLTLIGKFREGWSPNGETYPVIHGVVGETPYGKFITLYDSFRKRLSLGWGGAAAETIFSKKALIGGEHFPKDPNEFESVDFTLSYLSDWIGRSGLQSEWPSQDNENQLTVRYRRPKSERVLIGDKTLTAGYAFSFNHENHRVGVLEEAHVEVQPVREFTPEHIIAKTVRPIQDLLTFATNTPNELEEIGFFSAPDLGGGALRRNCNWIGVPIFRLPSKKDLLTPDDMLFTFDESKEAGLNIFQNWIDFAARSEAFCTVYFTSLYAEPSFLEEKLLRLMSAFTLLVSSLCDVSDRTKFALADLNSTLESRFSSEDRQLLEHVIPTGHEIEMPFYFLKLLKENDRLMGQIINTDFEDFVRTVCTTLVFAERRLLGSTKPFEPDELHFAMQKIRVLVKIQILKELGFDMDQVTRLMQRNNEFVYLKSV